MYCTTHRREYVIAGVIGCKHISRKLRTEMQKNCFDDSENSACDTQSVGESLDQAGRFCESCSNDMSKASIDTLVFGSSTKKSPIALSQLLCNSSSGKLQYKRRRLVGF